MNTITFKMRMYEIQEKPYKTQTEDPIKFGLGRLKFREQKLLELIAFAEPVHLAAAKILSTKWQRQLELTRGKLKRFMSHPN